MEWRLFADLAEQAGQRRVRVDPGPAATVEDALAALFDRHPKLRERVVDEDGAVRDAVTVLHDGEPVADLARPVAGELALLPPASGG